MKGVARAWLPLSLCMGFLFGCSPEKAPDHWLEECQSDAACGSLLCLSGVCTVTCRSAAECAKSEEQPAGCYEATSGAETDGSFLGVCESDSRASSAELVGQLDEVPSCPEPGRTTGLPGIFVPEPPVVARYAGPAVVASVTAEKFGFTDTVAVLEMMDAPGQTLSVRFRVGDEGPASVLIGSFTPGQTFEMTLESGGAENLHFLFLVLRDQEQRLLLAYHDGADQLYRAGRFETAAATGFTLELRPSCRSWVDEGCFEHQSQAEYTGRFTADAPITIESYTPAQISIDGSEYAVDFSAVSVDGGKPLCSQVAYPGRYINFIVVPAKP